MWARFNITRRSVMKKIFLTPNKFFSSQFSRHSMGLKSGECLEGVCRVSGGFLEGVWRMPEPKMIFLLQNIRYKKIMVQKKVKKKIWSKKAKD